MTTPDEPQEGEWAKPVEHLEVGDLPDDALNLNVAGRAPLRSCAGLRAPVGRRRTGRASTAPR